MAEMSHSITLTDREYDALKTRVIVLEAALRHVRMILKSDSIEYDDMRGMDSIIDAALARQEHGLQLDRGDEHGHDH